MIPSDVTFEIIQAMDQQVIVRGLYYGAKPSVFLSLRREFEAICKLLNQHHAFIPVKPAHIEQIDDHWLYLQIFDIVESSLRVDELIDWVKEVAQRQFLTPQQYAKYNNKSVI